MHDSKEIVYLRLVFLPEIKIKLRVFTNVNIFLIKHYHKMKWNISTLYQAIT